MAINVNKVYRAVLAVVNREQRGYLTPDQFNRIGRMVQLDLLEKSFYEYNRFLTRRKAGLVNNEYGNIAANLKDKIDVFSKSTALTPSSGSVDFPSDYYRTVSITSDSRKKIFQEVKKSEIPYITSSKLTAPSTSYPVFYKEGNTINVLPDTITSIDLDYIKEPDDPVWGYTTGSNSQLIYSSSASTDFELHPSEEVDLITKILAYSGIVIKDPTVIQAASQEEINKVNQENS